LRQIHTVDFRTQCRAQLPYFQHAVHTFRFRSATVYSSNRFLVPPRGAGDIRKGYRHGSFHSEV
jgi:hypothetical protein